MQCIGRTLNRSVPVLLDLSQDSLRCIDGCLRLTLRLSEQPSRLVDGRLNTCLCSIQTSLDDLFCVLHLRADSLKGSPSSVHASLSSSHCSLFRLLRSSPRGAGIVDS